MERRVDEGRLRNGEERARTLFRLLQIGKPRPLFPFRAHAGFGSPLLSSSCPAPPRPFLPRPGSHRPCPRPSGPGFPVCRSAPPGRRRGKRRQTPGTNSGRGHAGRGGQKLRTAEGKFLCRPRRWLAARASFPFPFPWSGPRASGCSRRGRGRGLGHSRGRPSASVGDTQPTQIALPGRRGNEGCRLSAHTSTAEGHFFNAGKTHSPAARLGVGGEVNHHHLSNVLCVPKTSPRGADLS